MPFESGSDAIWERDYGAEIARAAGERDAGDVRGVTSLDITDIERGPKIECTFFNIVLLCADTSRPHANVSNVLAPQFAKRERFEWAVKRGRHLRTKVLKLVVHILNRNALVRGRFALQLEECSPMHPFGFINDWYSQVRPEA
jgi:hypothetical protein